MAGQYADEYGGYSSPNYNSYADPSRHPRKNSSFYDTAYNPAVPSTTASPTAYSSQQHLVDEPAPLGGTTTNTTTGSAGPNRIRSPFDTVFDDNTYPATTSQNSLANQPPLPYENGYYGRRTSSDELRQTADGIPLQDRANKGGADSPEDHIYDIPQRDPEQQRQQEARKGPVRFGELGMFGANSKRIPWVVYILTIAQVAVFIGEIAKNGILTGSPIEIKPSFNPMIGPSPYVLINMGARYVPCMHNIKDINYWEISWQCPNTTTTNASCSLSELCGFGGFKGTDANPNPEPNQWFRFIIPMFMHAGIIHIGFNMMLQLTLGRDMERAIGPIRFFLVYISSGIFGFVLGGNYAATGIESTGASGSLFGIIALTLLDLLYSWRDRRSPVKELLFIILEIVISFVLGLLPGLDNFSHIGGFLMGLALGISVLHSPNALRRRIGEDASYASVNATYSAAKPLPFLRSPIGFFKGRKPLWWAWWFLRAGTIVGVIVGFIMLLKNFYTLGNTCSWCKYLSCLPVNNWCDSGNLQVITTKRDVLTAFAQPVSLA